MADKFPIDTGLVSWDTTVTQKWSVEEGKSVSGKRRTLVQQSFPAWTFSLKFPALDKQQVDLLLNFYAKMRGKWGSFLYKDFENHHVENVELLKQGDEYLCKTNMVTMYEPCYAVENLHVFIDGVETGGYTEENGKIIFEDLATANSAALGMVTATYDFYYLVSFGDELKISQAFDNIYNVSLDLQVVRE